MTSSMQAFWSKRHWWLYVLLVPASASALADAYSEPLRTQSTVKSSTQFEVNFSTKRTRNIIPWSVVTMTDGTKFQVPGSANLFLPGDTMQLEITPLWHEVVRFSKGGGKKRYWNELLAAREKEFDLFPALVLLCSLLLLIPFRTPEPRWYLHGILVLMGFGWLVTMIGMGGLKPWG